MLEKLKYIPFTSKELKPTGWLKEQLQIQAEGLSGNLDLIWPDIRDSKWIGGDRDGWERVPYWLDGFIPLAYLLEDEALIKRAKRYMDAIFDGQNEDGWLCPCEKEERNRYDVWVVFLICKVLVVYYDCSGDERVEDCLYRALKHLNRHVELQTLFNWGSARWFEGLISIYWLYERQPEEWMIDLCIKLYAQGTDYKALFANWRFQKPDVHGNWSFLTHVVNLAMSLKSEALISRLTKSDGNAFAKHALSLLRGDHGMAACHFTGDECLSGSSPIQGSELCSVVEAMYAYEHLISVTGDSYWSDMLEHMAFNALPAAISPDMWSHQYDQMTNQVECSYLPEDHVVFRTNDGDAHLFGLEPHFGCCTANFNQGWPKFVLSAIMKSEKGIVITAIAPVKVSFVQDGIPVTCEIITNYPFEDGYKVCIHSEESVELELGLRIPSFAETAKIDGAVVEHGENCIIQKQWNGTEMITVEFTYSIRKEERPNGLYCIKRGPLLYAMQIDERKVMHEFEKNGVIHKFPYCDYEVFASSKWNYAMEDGVFELFRCERGEYLFSPEGTPIYLETSMSEIDWGFEYGVCLPVPKSRVPVGKSVIKRWIPYGCTNLRLTEVPFAE